MTAVEPQAAGDKVLLGTPPQPSEFVPGALWLVLTSLGSDPSGLTVHLDAYAYTPPYSVEWGDGTRQDVTAFAQSYAPSGGAPGLWHLDHVYAKPMVVNGYVEAGVRGRFQFILGSPAPSSKARITKQRTAEAREDAINQAGTTGRVRR